jgi:hypothetical protein|tara:strand:- start:174 stop:476 length:303 start_codon:yes stop_codon:yes gene_type:complete
MNRNEILLEAQRLINTDRQEIYGPALENHRDICKMWQVVIDRCNGQLKPHHVALMMALLKVCRLCRTESHMDSFVDAAAYIALAGEMSETQNATQLELLK